MRQRTLNAFNYPTEGVIRDALSRYQTDFRKPSFTVYALDFSGSMEGEGQQQLTEGDAHPARSGAGQQVSAARARRATSPSS